MPGFKFDNQRLDNKLVAAVAGALDEANVPNLLWGNYLLAVFGVPAIVDVSFPGLFEVKIATEIYFF